MGSGADADVTIAVDDPERPSIVVCYPGFDANAQSWKEVREVVSRGVLVDGVVGIVKAFVKDGAVLPELPNARLRRTPKRRGSER